MNTENRFLSNLVVPREEAREKIQARIDKGQQLRDLPIRSGAELENARKKYSTWSSSNSRLLSTLFDSSSIAKLHYNALLYRRLKPGMSAAQEAAFFEHTNTPTATARTEYEEAVSDANETFLGASGAAILNALDVGTSSESFEVLISQERNNAFRAAYLDALPTVVRNAYLETKGGASRELSAAGLKRLRSAMLVYLFQGTATSEAFVQTAIEGGGIVSGIYNAIGSAAAHLTAMEHLTRQGGRDADLSTTADIAAGMQVFEQYRHRNQTLEEFLQQTSFISPADTGWDVQTTASLLWMAIFESTVRSSTAAFNSVVDYTQRVGASPVAGATQMFGDAALNKVAALRDIWLKRLLTPAQYTARRQVDQLTIRANTRGYTPEAVTDELARLSKGVTLVPIWEAVTARYRQVNGLLDEMSRYAASEGSTAVGVPPPLEVYIVQSSVLATDIGRYRENVTDKINRLKGILGELELIPERIPAFRSVSSPEQTDARGNEVFIVHGHDMAAKSEVARFVEKLGLEATILDEKPGRGMTIIEKFEDHASNAGFAIVLLTPDDVGAAKDKQDNLNPRARQNVIFEMGYFVKGLGRGRVCAMSTEEVEIPSDLAGVEYIHLDPYDGWKWKLRREMKAAGLPVE